MHAGLLLAFGVVLGASAPAETPAFRPDPLSVQRYGPAYRYPQAGWIVLHIEGEPYERGVQHGRLLAPEIAAHLRCYANVLSAKDPANGLRHCRTLVNALLLRRYDPEFLEEMKGIADGASAAGARFEDRNLDLLDVVVLNSWPEVMTLDGALGATATGLEGKTWPAEASIAPPASKPNRCSAFAATGPATADGKIVFGHITMFSLYPSSFYNVWIDIKPAKGQRIAMQTYPAGMQSGMDYYLNDSGILISETTIAQTKFDGTGLALASRIRKAAQYATSIDDAVKYLAEGNNGLYTNEWLLGDTKTNEIAMYELGTHKTKLWRSSKNEWFGDTPGFYWGCNNTKDREVRLETMASTADQPGNAVFKPSDRDRKWLELYDKWKGKIDADFGRHAFTTPPIAAYHSVDAKVTTTALAKDMKSWALFGPPLGRTWQPTFKERQEFPEIQPMVGNPWTMLTIAAPDKSDTVKVVDLHDPKADHFVRLKQDEENPEMKPAWHGTLLPLNDGDLWLTSAFAEYERVVALEKALRHKAADGKLTAADRERLSLELYAWYSGYQRAARSRPEVFLDEVQRDLRSDEWYRLAAGKGVLALHALRKEIGAEPFDRFMDDFGRQHAGKEVNTMQFCKALGAQWPKAQAFLGEQWLHRPGLPGDNKGPVAGAFSVKSFHDDVEHTLIVYGTRAEGHINKEAAEALQQAIIQKHSNFTVPIRADKDVTDEEAKGCHLILIGRPECNTWTARCQKGLPVMFGSQSFRAGGDNYAHALSAVTVAGENPLDKKYSVVVIAGLSPTATRRAAPLLLEGRRQAEIVVHADGGVRSLVTSTPVLEWPEDDKKREAGAK